MGEHHRETWLKQPSRVLIGKMSVGYHISARSLSQPTVHTKAQYSVSSANGSKRTLMSRSSSTPHPLAELPLNHHLLNQQRPVAARRPHPHSRPRNRRPSQPRSRSLCCAERQSTT